MLLINIIDLFDLKLKVEGDFYENCTVTAFSKA